jgi:hypothetical protein
MTTSHSDESVEDALFFVLECTAPDEEYAPDGCGSVLIVSVGSGDWNVAIEQYITARTTQPHH